MIQGSNNGSIDTFGRVNPKAEELEFSNKLHQKAIAIQNINNDFHAFN